MPILKPRTPLDIPYTILISVLVMSESAFAQDAQNIPNTANRPTHQQSAQQHNDPSSPDIDTPAIPEGMTLDEVLDYSASPTPDHFPDPAMDDQLYAFTLFEQLEYRMATDNTPDHFGWEAQGWIGGDFNKFWWKNEGEAVFDGANEGETETDLLYSRLITPFWNFQIGAQYANEWTADEYDDRWSGVIALQGLAPYKFELDNSLYISEDGDVTLAFEAEYDIRITQRLVLQPLVGLGVAFQDIPERGLGAGVTDANLDLRLRYEITRKIVPYMGVRYRSLVGETSTIAEAAGAESEKLFFMAGFRFAF